MPYLQTLDYPEKLQDANTLAYFAASSVTKKKEFMMLFVKSQRQNLIPDKSFHFCFGFFIECSNNFANDARQYDALIKSRQSFKTSIAVDAKIASLKQWLCVWILTLVKVENKENNNKSKAWIKNGFYKTIFLRAKWVDEEHVGTLSDWTI